VLSQRLDGVPFGQVDADDETMRALSQRVAPDDGERRLERTVREPCLELALGGSLQRVQRELAEPLALQQGPVVVPVGQQLVLERPSGRRHGPPVGRAVEQPVRQRGRAPQVDVHAVREPDVRARRGDHPVPGALEPPERRPQAGRRTRFRRVSPEHPGQVEAAPRLLVQGDEREEPLRSGRKRHRLSSAAELEAVEQRQRERTVAAVTRREGHGEDLRSGSRYDLDLRASATRVSSRRGSCLQSAGKPHADR
jgi:hypothetical protein